MSRITSASNLFHNLREATVKQVLRQHAEHWASIGGLPRVATRESRTVTRGLSYEQAVEYLCRVNQKLLASQQMLSAMVVPFVVGWWIEAEEDEGSNLGFPVEVWMTDSETQPGKWDIVDRSTPLYQLPWMAGMGWALAV